MLHTIEIVLVIVKPPRIDPELEKMHEKLSKLQEEFYKAMNNEKALLIFLVFLRED